MHYFKYIAHCLILRFLRRIVFLLVCVSNWMFLFILTAHSPFAFLCKLQPSKEREFNFGLFSFEYQSQENKEQIQIKQKNIKLSKQKFYGRLSQIP